MNDEKQQPTPSAEQIAQWKKEVETEYEKWKNTVVNKWATTAYVLGYVAGKTKSFEEVARLQAQSRDWTRKYNALDDIFHKVQAELERVTKQLEEKDKEIRDLMQYLENPQP